MAVMKGDRNVQGHNAIQDCQLPKVRNKKYTSGNGTDWRYIEWTHDKHFQPCDLNKTLRVGAGWIREAHMMR
jgi:hypothetical protein